MTYRILLALAVLGLLATACEPGVTVRFENRTDRTLTVTYARPLFSRPAVDTFSLEGGEVKGYSDVGLVDDEAVLRVEARTEGGTLVYAEELTLAEAKRRSGSDREIGFVFPPTTERAATPGGP